MTKKSSKLRIIAGKWRGRKITFPNSDIIRPTTDRLRETAFNWLAPYLENANCLDAFSGSGILGFEALSRGAKHITFIDELKINTECILNNAKILNVESDVDVYCKNFFSFDFFKSPFDIIFLDPPYHKNLTIKSIDFLQNKKCIHKDTIIYIEGEKEISFKLPQSFNPLKQKTTKHIMIALGKISNKVN